MVHLSCERGSLRKGRDLPNTPVNQLFEAGVVIGGRYTIVEHLASGGMAEVYVATQAPFGRRVALKVIEGAQEPGHTKRFMREAVALSRLTHPNTITVFDFGETDDNYLYLAMELLDGETLADRLEREHTISAMDTVEIALQIARSLAEAHEIGIVHRDLKPGNVFLGRIQRNLVKVLDFGIATYMNSEPGVTRLTQMGTVPGTPEYMSPEQGKAEAVGPSSDIYSLSVMMYEMLSGDVPFVGGSPLATMIKHVNEEVPPLPPTVPHALADLVMWCLDKNPAERPQDANTFIEALSEAALKTNTLPGPAPSGVSSVVPGPQSSRASSPPPRAADEAVRSDRVPERSEPAAAEPTADEAEATRVEMPGFQFDETKDRQPARPSPPKTELLVTPPEHVDDDDEPIWRTRSDHLHAPTQMDQQAAPRPPGVQRGSAYSSPAALNSRSTGPTSAPPEEDLTSADIELPTENPYQVFMAFSRPVRDAIAGQPGAAEFRQALMFARSAWNAVLEGPESVAEARQYLQKQGSPAMIAIFEELVRRKMGDWQQFRWLIEDIEVIEQPGGYQVKLTRRVMG